MASRSSLICAVVTAKSDVVDCRTVWGKLGENAVAMVAVRARAAATFMVMIICGLLLWGIMRKVNDMYNMM